MKRIRISVDFYADVPDSTPVEEVFVTFHNGYDVMSVQTAEGPVGAVVEDHETSEVEEVLP